MTVSAKTQKVLTVALANKSAQAELLAEIAAKAALTTLGSHKIAAIIIATAASATTDFGAVLVGDVLVKVPSIAGNPVFGVCVTVATAPMTPAIGDLVLVLRAI